jgi:large subunit ribosomal protein L25
MEIVSLKATAREKDRKASALRRDGIVPCVLYGNDTENIPIQCPLKELSTTYGLAGESTIVELDIGGKTVPVLFQHLDIDSVSNHILHADFFAVNMKKEIEAKIPVRFDGEAPVVKEFGGVLVTSMDHVTVRCLPTNLPHDLPVSVEKIAEFTDQLLVSDISVPSGVSIVESPETVIMTAQEPRKEEEVVPVVAEEGAEGESVEGEGEGAAGEKEGEKKDGESGGDGEGEKKDS